MRARSILSIAVASGRVGYVAFLSSEPVDWGISIKSARSRASVCRFADRLIRQHEPDSLVFELCDDACRKGSRTRRSIAALADVATLHDIQGLSVPRPHRYRTKYDEADAIAKRYPELGGYLPKFRPRYFEFEPRSMVLFEAVALAEAVIYGQADQDHLR